MTLFGDKRKVIAVAAVAVYLLLVIAFVVWVIWANSALELTEISVKSADLPKSFDGYRIAQISDLHNAEFGENNSELLKTLARAEPDMIALTGDIIDSRNTDIELALRFVEEAQKIAPCYYVTGNHESRWGIYPEFRAGLVALGVVVLDNESVEIEKNGEEIRVLGLLDPGFSGLYDDAANDIVRANLAAAAEGVGADEFTLLLAHQPHYFEIYSEAGMDLTLSGHIHGGQFRLPFVGGLAGPGNVLFPKYDAGLYREGESQMIVSRGIGPSAIPLRFNNRPEVVLAVLESTQK